MISMFSFRQAKLFAAGMEDLYRYPQMLDTIDIVYCLLTNKEIDLDGLQEVYEDSYAVDFKSYPIQDYSIPPSMTSFHKVLKDISSDIKRGKNVLIHCHGGVGRTGTVLTGLFILLGKKYQQALNMVRSKRLAVETPEQHRFLQEYARELGRL